jgi:hypothetical protein
MLKRDRLAIIRQYYPNALTTIDSVNRFIDLLEDRFALEPGRIMLADSICSDDVNSIQYPARALDFRGPFKMGGLDGFPFTGLTGMGAFAGHVPDDGAVFVYYGPHIGVSKGGSIGEILRIGQHLPSGCCGAARGALAKLLAGAIEPGRVSELDYQMNTLEQLLLAAEARIREAATPLQEATEVIYEAIDRRIEELVAATRYPCRYVFLMGAILINSDSDMGSFSATKKLVVIDRETGSRHDLLAEYLGQ